MHLIKFHNRLVERIKGAGLVARAIKSRLEQMGFKMLLEINQATRYASQHIWCMSQARINWEGCARKDIQRKNGGDSRYGGTI